MKKAMVVKRCCSACGQAGHRAPNCPGVSVRELKEQVRRLVVEFGLEAIRRFVTE